MLYVIKTSRYSYKLLLVRNWNILLLYINSPIYLILLPVNSKEAFKSFLGEKICELLIFSPFKIIAASQYRQLYSDGVATIFTAHYYFNHTNSSGIVLEYAGKDLPGFGRTSSHSINSPRADRGAGDGFRFCARFPFCAVQVVFMDSKLQSLKTLSRYIWKK